MKSYDFIIAGGGAAGLGLAYQMAGSNLRGRSILIVDRDQKDQNDRTWCFWSNQTTRFDHLVYRRWDQVEVVSDDFHQVFDLSPYEYRMVRGIDFYRGVKEALCEVPGIAFLHDRVNAVEDTKDRKMAQVTIQEEPYEARWAFDSIFKPSDFSTGPKQYHYLKQHFKGWEIETPTDAFNPRVATLFDFRTPQKGCMRFFYILPYSKRRALVEYTLFSHDLLKPHEYDRAISEYIEQVLHIPQYRIDSVESGVIPMTDRPFPRKLSERVMAIGTKGGIIKPSSGYGFLRMQKDAAAIVHSLETYGNPFHVSPPPWRYRQYDSLMLQVMYRQGGLMKTIFTELFKNNAIQDVFRFLDEVQPIQENLGILASLPPEPFIKALFKVKLLRSI
jgi:lycopene beta-cyclase